MEIDAAIQDERAVKFWISAQESHLLIMQNLALPRLDQRRRQRVQVELHGRMGPLRKSTSESGAACLIDGDVLVLRIGDREVAPTPELVRAFDGDIETVYDARAGQGLRGASVSSSR